MHPRVFIAVAVAAALMLAGSTSADSVPENKEAARADDAEEGEGTNAYDESSTGLTEAARQYLIEKLHTPLTSDEKARIEETCKGNVTCPFESCVEECLSRFWWRFVPAAVLGGAAAGVGAVTGVGLAVSALGFGAGGVVGGSLAASAQATFYGGATGGVFSLFQSAGATGCLLSKTSLVAAGTGGALVGYIIGPTCIDDCSSLLPLKP